jgi:hypothetical protein
MLKNPSSYQSEQGADNTTNSGIYNTAPVYGTQVSEHPSPNHANGVVVETPLEEQPSTGCGGVDSNGKRLYRYCSYKGRCCAFSALGFTTVFACLAVNSAFALLAVNALFSLLSVNSVFSICSLNSGLSVLSAYSFLSIGCSGGYMQVCF